MDVVGLSARLFNAYPHELDGGRRQRVGGTVFFHSAQQVGGDPFLPQRIHQSRCFRHL